MSSSVVDGSGVGGNLFPIKSHKNLATKSPRKRKTKFFLTFVVSRVRCLEITFDGVCNKSGHLAMCQVYCHSDKLLSDLRNLKFISGKAHFLRCSALKWILDKLETQFLTGE